MCPEKIVNRNTEWNIDTLLEVSGCYWQSFTLHAAVKLDVFTIIDQEEITAGELARRIESSERGVTMLLNALSAMGLLEKRGERYVNSLTSLRYLSKNSSDYMGFIILHHHNLVDSWARLDQAVKTGQPVRQRTPFTGEGDFREHFLMGMWNMATRMAPRVIEAIDLSPYRHLLDLGGGAGAYAVYFCQVYPHLRATVYDLPATESLARRMITQHGLQNRIEFIGGDYLEEDIPGTYDVAWLSQILHAEGYEECKKIIQKAVSKLVSGGLILVHDFLLHEGRDGPLRAALFSLNMLLGTPKGQSYTEKEVVTLLAEAGVESVHSISFTPSADSKIVLGYVRRRA